MTFWSAKTFSHIIMMSNVGLWETLFSQTFEIKTSTLSFIVRLLAQTFTFNDEL